jgi:predicted acyltransferase
MDFNQESNIAMVIDKAVLGCHRDGVIWHADGTWTFNPEYQYTWILSSFNFIVTVMMGCFAGQVLYSEENSVTARKAWMLAGIGAALIVAGLLMSPWFPIIKKIWSSSMTLLSGGICYLLMAVTYYLIDVRKCPWEMKGIASFGMNSIAVYMIGQKVKFTSVSQSLLFGLEQFTGAYYPLVISAGNALILYFIIRVMYRYRIFLKV